MDEMPEWAMGVCEDSHSRKRKWFPLEQNRYWTIQLQSDDYVTLSAALVILLLKENPRGTNIYLDYELTDIICYHFHDSLTAVLSMTNFLNYEGLVSVSDMI